MSIDYPYNIIYKASCAHVQRTRGQIRIGVVDRHGRKCTICDTCGPCQTIRKYTEASFFTDSNESVHFQVTHVPKSPKLAIFTPTTTDRQTDYFTPCACVRGNDNKTDYFTPWACTWDYNYYFTRDVRMAGSRST